MKILVLNAGSSSQKSCLYQLSDSLPQVPIQPFWEAKIDWSRHQGVAEIKIKGSAVIEAELENHSRPSVISWLLNTLIEGKTQVIEELAEIAVVGHRVVHGGQEYRESTIITPEVKTA